MEYRLWRSLKFDNIYARYEWSPAGSPGAGDWLLLDTGGAFINGGPLDGATIHLSGRDAATQPTLVVSGAVSLQVIIEPQDFYDSAQGNATGYGTVRVVGHPHVDVELNPIPFGTWVIGSVAIDPYSTWSGSFRASEGNLAVTGAQTSLFANEHTEFAGYRGGVAQIDVQVVGVGTFYVGFGGEVVFGRGVGSGQTIDLAGLVVAKDGPGFNAAIEFHDFILGRLELEGLLADSFTYKDGHLTLFSHDTAVKDLRIKADWPSVSVAESAGRLFIEESIDPPGDVMRPVFHF